MSNGSSSSSSRNSASFIYPSKSLLGNIQPAPDSSPPLSSSPELSRSFTFDIGSKILHSDDPESAEVVPISSLKGHPPNSFNQSSKKRRIKRSQSIATTGDCLSNRTQSEIPNFSHFPAAGEDPNLARSFSTHSPSSSGAGSSSSSSIASLTIPEAEPAQPPQEYNARHPPALPVVAQHAFTHTSDFLLPNNSPSNQFLTPPWNPSELGIVHLPSVARERSSSSNLKPPNAGSQSSGSGRSSNLSGYHTPEEGLSDDDSKSQLISDPLGSTGSFERAASPISDAPLVSVQFQYIQDEHGNHIVIGREGQLKRCEDEPIRTPGAVQGFGVLVVVEQQEETLVVRQVSENSTELLGLSPRYLFNLECFTDILPETQASLLWDNVEFLSEPLSNNPDEIGDEDEGRDAPDVFLLSGYGAPGTAVPNVVLPPDPHDPWGVHEGKRRWTCWCAIHRPQPSPHLSTDDAVPYKSVIVMEFELESDRFNPLYHPPSFNPASTSSHDSPQSVASHSSAVCRSDSAAAISTSGDSRVENLVSNSGHTNSVLTRASSSSSSTGSGSSLETLRNISDSEITPPAISEDIPPQYPQGESVTIGPLQAQSGGQQMVVHGLTGDTSWAPSTEDIFESTTARSKPLLALERLRRMSQMPGSPESSSPGFSRPNGRARRVLRRSTLGPDAGGRKPGGAPGAPNGSVSMMDVFAVMAQINEQLGQAPDLDTFLKVVVGVIKDLTQFHRVLVYQFDEIWNGQVVAELVDWGTTHDLFKGLHFPASDIPAQARELYKINKVRILYDRDQPTARIVVRNKEDVDQPLNMTHCYLRAMSPIHIKYLANMGVRASMSVSIMAFGTLWGLVACHSYGEHGMRVSFPVRQMLKLLSQSISRNIERLSYAQRLHTRKLINTIASDNHPTGYIVSDADDLLGLFDADFGILVIGDGAKILGPNEHGQEILIIAEYLRLKQFNSIQVSQAVTKDFPDLSLSTGLEVIAGLLSVPLSSGGSDFIAFLRKGQPREVHWAGKPYKPAEMSATASLEPRKSFKIWSETVAGRCRAWSDEQLETAGVLALVYGKFIEVWREKENAVQTTKLTNLLLSNASHEVRTPLNAIINYLEMALNGPLDFETRDNLSRSHIASKNLLFTINDLLDLTRFESGKETSFSEPFDLADTIQDAVSIYRNEAARRDILFEVDVAECPTTVIGDSKKIRTVVQNLTANALKYTSSGKITVTCIPFGEPEGLRSPSSTAVEIVIADTGCGIPPIKLESIFREIEQVESSEPKTSTEPGVGLGLAVVARIVEQLGGQLRVDSKVDEEVSDSSTGSRSNSSLGSFRPNPTNEIDSLVEALTSSHVPSHSSQRSSPSPSNDSQRYRSRTSSIGSFRVSGSRYPVRPIKIPEIETEPVLQSQNSGSCSNPPTPVSPSKGTLADEALKKLEKPSLRVLIVEDNDINRLLLAKRLRMDGHTVVNTTNGQEGLDKVISDRNFDCVLMDLSMPLLNGYEATERIREVEKASPPSLDNQRVSLALNGRIPIFAVSASLYEQQRSKLSDAGMDGWILKPIDFKRLAIILQGVTDFSQRECNRYYPGYNWEIGGWLALPSTQNSPSLTSPVLDKFSTPLPA